MKNKSLLLPLVAVAIGFSIYRTFDKKNPSSPNASNSNVVLKRTPAQTSPSEPLKSKVSKVQPKNPPPQFNLDGYHARLLKIKACYNNENCRYDSSDPKAYEFAVGNDLAKKINQLKSYVQKNGSEDKKLSQIAREFMSLPDGRVKEAALDLMATQPPSQENLSSVLNDVIGSYNERLIPQALMELNKYPDENSQKSISKAISESLENGSFRVKQKLAEHSQNYINSTNYDYYSSVSKNLPADSLVKTHLDAALTEFRMRKSGG